MFVRYTVLSVCSWFMLSAFTFNPLANLMDDSPEANKPLAVYNKSLATASVMTFAEGGPVLDKEICDTDLDISIRIDGLNVFLVNTTESEYTDVEWIMGDGGIVRGVDAFQYEYQEEDIFYLAVTVYNADDGCVDFLSASYYVKEGSPVRNYTTSDIIDAKDEVLNLDVKR